MKEDDVQRFIAKLEKESNSPEESHGEQASAFTSALFTTTFRGGHKLL